MSLLWHILETGLLVLAAYLGGCVIGYGARRLHHAAQHRPVRAVAVPVATTQSDTVVAPLTAILPKPIAPASIEILPAIVEPQPTKLRPAARLAAAAADEAPPEPPIVAVAKPAPKSRRKVAGPDPRPKALPAPRNGTPDRLRQIKGIGPKIEASLHEMGIFHLDQIAAWTPENVDWVDARLAFKGRVTREAWVEQARALNSVAA